MEFDELAEAYNRLHMPYVARIRFSKRQLAFTLLLLSGLFFMIGVNIYRDRIPILADSLLLIAGWALALPIMLSSLYAIIHILHMERHEEIFFPEEGPGIQDEELPLYSILCPLYQEGSIVKQTIEALCAIDYPIEKLDIILLLEEDDHVTRTALPSLPAHFKILEIPAGMPRTKPRSLNYGLRIARGEFLAIYDAEDVPPKNQLRNAVSAFRTHGADVWAVQARLGFDNPEDNWLSLMFYAEFCFWYDYFLPYLFIKGYPVSLGGTSNHFRVAEMREIGGWDAFNVTEDADLTLRIYKRNKKILLLYSQSLQHSPTRVRTWVKQRARWLKGLTQTFLVHSREGLTMILAKYFILILLGVITAINIFILSMLVLSALSGPYFDVILKLWTMAFIAPFLPGIIVYAWVLRGYNSVTKYKRFFFPGVLVYWPMYMCASLYAIFQLVATPFFWDKTSHEPGA
jgi:cellulose synthase/poly-beta-1,6-N-acetylglucosamine synthase-like glycosyltransferase